MSTPQPDISDEIEWPPPGEVAALEPKDFHVGLTAAEASALIPKEIG